MNAYAEIGVTTNFSFLRGASHPKEFAHAAGLLGYAAIGIADRNTLAGVVRMYSALQELREKGEPAPKQLVGCRLVFRDGTPDIAVWPRDRAAYGRLCRLLTTGNLRGKKGECHLDLADLLAWGDGLEMAVLEKSSAPSTDPPPSTRVTRNARAHAVATLAGAFPGSVRLGATMHRAGEDHRRLVGRGAGGDAEAPGRRTRRLGASHHSIGRSSSAYESDTRRSTPASVTAYCPIRQSGGL